MPSKAMSWIIPQAKPEEIDPKVLSYFQQATTRKEYEKIEQIVREHPLFINAVYSDTNSSLCFWLLTTGGSKAESLLFFLLSHPKLDLHYQKPKSKVTDLHSILSKGRMDFFNLLQNRPEIIRDKDEQGKKIKLTYDVIRLKLKTARNSYLRKLEKDHLSPDVEERELEIKNFEVMLSMIDKTTEKQARETADDTLLEELQAVRDQAETEKAAFQKELVTIQSSQAAAVVLPAAAAPKASQNRSAMFASDEGRMAISSTTHRVRNLAVPSQAEEKASEVSRDEADIMENIHEYVRLMQEQQNITLESNLAQIKIYDESNDVLQPLYDSISEEVLQSEPHGIRR